MDGLNYAVPRFEQKLQTAVQESVSSFNEGQLLLSSQGRQITVSGQVGSEAEKQSVVAAVAGTHGVANVRSQLTIVEASSTLAKEQVASVGAETGNSPEQILLAQSSSQRI